MTAEEVTESALVATTSLFQGEQAELFQELLHKYRLCISWCHESFKWSNQAANNAGVACCIVGMRKGARTGDRRIFDNESVRSVSHIGPYLVAMPDIVVRKRNRPISSLAEMRSEERRVGKECVSTCRSRWSRYH